MSARGGMLNDGSGLVSSLLSLALGASALGAQSAVSKFGALTIIGLMPKANEGWLLGGKAQSVPAFGKTRQTNGSPSGVSGSSSGGQSSLAFADCTCVSTGMFTVHPGTITLGSFRCRPSG